MNSREVEVRRSTRRRRTVSAYLQDGRVVVLIPDRFSRREEAEWVAKMVERLERKSGRTRSDDDLVVRARELAGAHDLPEPVSVRWVSNQHARWGSCTPADGSVRLSDRLRPMPSWVIDYVLVHELAHLVESGHGARFHALVARYPRTERAIGYLDGFAAAAHLEIEDDRRDSLVRDEDRE